MLRQLRQRAGLTVEDLAYAADLSQGYVSKLENNRIPMPRPATMEALADALGVGVEVLIGEAQAVPRVVERAYRESPAAFLKLAGMSRRERDAFAQRSSGSTKTTRLKNRLMK